LLWGLASWFKKPDEFSIGKRLAEKSIELSGSNILDRHFAYQQMIEICYMRADSGMVILNRQRIAYIDIN